MNADGIDFKTLGVLVPNQRLSLVLEGIELCRKEGVDMILAIGGGSVIDLSKAIDVVTNHASGSEMSYSCVITN